MVRVVITSILILFLSSFSDSEKEIKVFTSFDAFEPILRYDDDTTYVVNFWATWCKPCVAELPYFDKLAQEFEGKKLKVLLVSLDFADQVDSRLKPFIASRNVKSEVVVLDDPKANYWIPKIDENWSGAIPATYIYQGKKSQFVEGSFEQESLIETVKPFIKE